MCIYWSSQRGCCKPWYKECQWECPEHRKSLIGFCAGDPCPECGAEQTFVADESFEQNGDEVIHDIYFMCSACLWISHTLREHFKLNYVEEMDE